MYGKFNEHQFTLNIPSVSIAILFLITVKLVTFKT